MVREQVKLRYERMQCRNFTSADKELTAEEYGRMVKLAEEKGDARLSMILQTICALGIRVSELKAITVESVKAGKALIRNKRKERVILIPEKLARALLSYCAEKRIVSGMIFITRTGKALHRSNIWRMIKKIGKAAEVAAKKAFPHNPRHLFARIYYQIHHDLGGLASNPWTQQRRDDKNLHRQQRRAGAGKYGPAWPCDFLITTDSAICCNYIVFYSQTLE